MILFFSREEEALVTMKNQVEAQSNIVCGFMVAVSLFFVTLFWIVSYDCIYRQCSCYSTEMLPSYGYTNSDHPMYVEVVEGKADFDRMLITVDKTFALKHMDTERDNFSFILVLYRDRQSNSFAGFDLEF